MQFKNALGLFLFAAIQVVLVFSANAQNTGEDKAAIQKLKAQVEAAPDDLARHLAYVRAARANAPALEKQYALWMKKFPKIAAVPFAMGGYYEGGESPKAKPYLLKALKLNPKFAEAWAALAGDAELWGDFSASQEYMEKAIAYAPDNVDYLFNYAMSFAGKDEEKYESLAMDVVQRFPDHQRAAQALYWLAARTDVMADKMKYWEQLYRNYPADKFPWASYGIAEYFNALLTTNPEKALTLANEMAAGKEDVKQWIASKTLAEQVFSATKMLNEKKGAEAINVLNQIKLSRSSSFKQELLLLKAKANEISGNTVAAYDSLVVAYAKAPVQQLKSIMVGYGKKLGKDLAQIDVDVWNQLERTSQPATPFTLKNYLTNGMTSLSDYKGKVVLLTYWFPGCGPCRAEFPHFENVVRKFKGQGLEYVGINIVSKQNEFVLPFLKRSGYSFTPLEDAKDRPKGNLENRGLAPINFLIDKEGRVIFSFFRIGENNEDELELMIKMLLEGKKA